MSFTIISSVCSANPPKGRSAEVPETWSTDCGAYISFATLHVDDKQICVIRKQFHHTGHVINESEGAKISQIDPALKVYVSCLIQLVSTSLRAAAHENVLENRFAY